MVLSSGSCSILPPPRHLARKPGIDFTWSPTSSKISAETKKKKGRISLVSLRNKILRVTSSALRHHSDIWLLTEFLLSILYYTILYYITLHYIILYYVMLLVYYLYSILYYLLFHHTEEYLKNNYKSLQNHL